MKCFPMRGPLRTIKVALLCVVWLVGLAFLSGPHVLGGHPRLAWPLRELVALDIDHATTLAPKGVEVRDGRVLTVVEHAEDRSITSDLTALGGTVEGGFAGFTKAWLPISALVQASETPDVAYIRPPHRPVPLEVPQPRLVSEGVTLLGASLFHAKGVLGQGVRIAIIDVGFGGLTQAQRVGELHPRAIAWTRDYTGDGLEQGGPHGTAVAQVAHNMAPMAELHFARIADEVDLAQAVLDCTLKGVDIIVHAAGWVNTSFGDGTGGIADIARTATSAGILWVNAAGNHATQHWLGTPTIDSAGWLSFTPGVTELALTVEFPGLIEVALTWDEWPRATSDLDLYLLDPQGNTVAVSKTRQLGTAPPTEFVRHLATERGRYTVRVRAHRAPEPVPIELFSLGHPLEPHVPSSSILAPGNADEVVTVGAIGLPNWYTGPQQPYSSQGPTNDGRLKPDLTALDGVTNFAFPQFWGTSAAAPHVAGAAALLLSQARESGGQLPHDELRERLVRGAVDLGDPGPDPVYGLGRLRVFVEQARATRSLTVSDSAPLLPGDKTTVEITVYMPATQVGGLELRERLPEGLTGVAVNNDGASHEQEGDTLIWRWPVITPGETRTVRYTLTVPHDVPGGTYTLSGTVNRAPVTGDTSLHIGAEEGGLTVVAVAAPNPVLEGGTTQFSALGIDVRELRLRVHDLAGGLVYDSGWQPGPSYQWNLQDNLGRLVAGGIYLYWVEVHATEGHTERSRVERLLVVR